MRALGWRLCLVDPELLDLFFKRRVRSLGPLDRVYGLGFRFRVNLYRISIPL